MYLTSLEGYILVIDKKGITKKNKASKYTLKNHHQKPEILELIKVKVIN